MSILRAAAITPKNPRRMGKRGHYGGISVYNFEKFTIMLIKSRKALESNRKAIKKRTKNAKNQ